MTTVFLQADAQSGSALRHIHTHGRRATTVWPTSTLPPACSSPLESPPVLLARRCSHELEEFSPPLGFAYSLGSDNKTAVRGGYGIFYDMQADQNDTELAYNDLPGVYGSQSFTAPLGPTPVMILSQGPPPIIFSSITNPTGRASACYFHNPTTYIEEWNLKRRAPTGGGHGAPGGIRGHARRAHDLLAEPEPGYDADLDKFFPAPPGTKTAHDSTVPNIAAIRTEGHDII